MKHSGQKKASLLIGFLKKAGFSAGLGKASDQELAFPCHILLIKKINKP